MEREINSKLFTDSLSGFLKETFNDVEGIYLDKGTSLFETLNEVNAKTASTPAYSGGTTIAGHVEHIDFYLNVICNFMAGLPSEKIDWSQSWLTSEVSDPEWDTLKQKLHNSHDKLMKQIEKIDDWNDDRKIGGSLAAVVHTAYHLGALRQILKVAASE